MKLIESKAELMDTSINPLELIERVGRTCYKSNSEFTKESAVKFFRQLVDRKHFAMLEHATFIFEVIVDMENTNNSTYDVNDLIRHVSESPFMHVTQEYIKGFPRVLISGNLRAIKENGLFPLMIELIQVENYPELNYYFQIDVSSMGYNYRTKYPLIRLVKTEDNVFKTLTENEKENHLYTTFHFICDRGVSHEMVRHRPASFAQESTRYCNYSKEKFGNEITCIKPSFYDSNWSDDEKSLYENSLRQAEANYFMLLDKGKTPQQARGVLPTDLKTEVIMTANDAEWKHFFDLRADGVTGAPHPNMEKVAVDAKHLYEKRIKELFG